jgi:outer membrane receptor for ferrienterochelin and colicins
MSLLKSGKGQKNLARRELSRTIRLISVGLIGSVALVGSFAAAAQEEPKELKKVVVSAAGFEQKITDAPASVTVVSREELEAKPYTSLADALRDVEGIDVGSGFDKNGNISITMRGLPADYTLVMIDGKRQSDIGDIGPNNFGNSQFMYMPPLAAIERIEVVRGPMSTLYGADAIGGVINIITRKVADEWSGSISTGMTLQESSQYGDDRKTDIYVSGPLVEGLLGLAVRGSIYDRGQSDPTYSNELPLPDGSVWIDEGSFGDKKIVAAQNWNVGATLNWTPTEAHDLSLAYDIAKQRYDNTEGQSGTLDSVESLWRATGPIIQPRVGYTEYQRVEREQVSLTHVGRFDFGTWETSLTNNRSTNLGRSLPLTVEERTQLQGIWNQAKADQGLTTANAKPALTPAIRAQLEAQFLPRNLRTLEITSNTLDTKFDTAIGESHAISIGGQYYDAEMEDGVFGMDGGGYRDGAVQDHRQLAVFVEDHWALQDDLTATLGVRYDDHNIYGGNTSPRAYLTWRTNDNWTVKGGVSTGYKTPKPNQLFPGIVGFGGQGVSPFVGTPDLEAETSTNYEVAAYFDNLTGFSANATLFYNDFDDKIARHDAMPNCYNAGGTLDPSVAGNCVDIGPGWAELGYTTFAQDINVDEVITQGFELGARYAITPAWIIRGNYTYTDSEQKSGAEEGLPLVNTPKNMINATLSWQATDRLSLSLVAEIRDERYRDSVVDPVTDELDERYFKSYELFHLGARFKASESVTLNARVNNLLDDDLSSISYTLNEAGDGYNRLNDYNTTEKARSFWLSADVTF